MKARGCHGSSRSEPQPMPHPCAPYSTNSTLLAMPPRLPDHMPSGRAAKIKRRSLNGGIAATRSKTRCGDWKRTIRLSGMRLPELGKADQM